MIHPIQPAPLDLRTAHLGGLVHRVRQDLGLIERRVEAAVCDVTRVAGPSSVCACETFGSNRSMSAFRGLHRRRLRIL